MELLHGMDGLRSVLEFCYGLPRELWKEHRLQRFLGAATAAWLGRALWRQYGILRHRNLPQSSLGLPLIGHTYSLMCLGMDEFFKKAMGGRAAFVTNCLFSNVVLVSYPAYERFLRRAELDGKFTREGTEAAVKIAGSNSIILLPGGKGHEHHRRLRGKVLASLGPKHALALSPGLLQIIRATLDGMVTKTKREGWATFMDVAPQLAARTAALPTTAGLKEDVQGRLEGLLAEAAAGLMCLPINLGRWSQFGRSMIARKEVIKIISEVMDNPPQGHRNTIADLMKASEEGSALTLDEIVDTCVTLLLGGQITVADALPSLLVQLSSSPKWIQRISEEPLEMTSIEADSATLRFVREVLRMQPPASWIRRACPSSDLSLGESGQIPAGCPFEISLGASMTDMGQDFNPDRWTPELVREKFVAFGGNQPHECVAKHLALVELQLFVKVLCREYDFQALDIVPKPKFPFGSTYDNMLRVKVSAKISP